MCFIVAMMIICMGAMWIGISYLLKLLIVRLRIQAAVVIGGLMAFIWFIFIVFLAHIL